MFANAMLFAANSLALLYLANFIVLFCFAKKEPKKATRKRLHPVFGIVPWFSFSTTVTSTSVILLLGLNSPMLVTNLKVAADIIFLERVKTPFFEEKNTLITCVFSPRNVNKKGELYASLQELRPWKQASSLHPWRLAVNAIHLVTFFQFSKQFHQ